MCACVCVCHVFMNEAKEGPNQGQRIHIFILNSQRPRFAWLLVMRNVSCVWTRDVHNMIFLTHRRTRIAPHHTYTESHLTAPINHLKIRRTKHN